jgi:hypothetical protein
MPGTSSAKTRFALPPGHDDWGRDPHPVIAITQDLHLVKFGVNYHFRP